MEQTTGTSKSGKQPMSGRDMDAPRKLSQDEIEEIVNKIPSARGIFPRSVDSVNQHTREHVACQLREIKIRPSKINKLASIIYSRYEKTRVRPGNPAGVRSALGLASPLTQLTLNSFHKSGAMKNELRGIDAVTALVAASANNKGQNIHNFFQE